jgi:outer membrane protein TolC
MNKKLLLITFCNLISLCLLSQKQGLDYYIQQGIQNSPLLKDYQNQIQSASIDSLLLNAERKPTLTGNSMIMVAPTYNEYGYDEAITNTGTYAALISASQTIFAKKTYKPQYEAIRIQKQSLANTSKISEHDLKKNISDQYITAFISLNQYNYAQSTYKLLKDEELILEKMVEQGVYKQTDYLSFQIATQSQEIQITQTKNQYRNDLRQLNLICGITDTAYQELPTPVMESAVKQTQYVSPLLIQFKLDSLSIINRKDLVNANYRPHLNWFADAGLLGSNPSVLYKNFGTSFGVNFSVPIYDGKQKKLNYQKLTITESTRNNYQTFFKTQYNQHLQQIATQLSENEKVINQIQKQLTSSEKLIAMSKQLLNTGTLSVTDFIITIMNYIDMKNQMNQAQLLKLQLTNEFNYWNW